jgi:D-beta-D-heptose 7-phosphate kinase/D-beta-D-heptose 1-phosphate adenosyltransferase
MLVPDLIREAREREKFLAVDPKRSDFSSYRGASLVTPNSKEAERASGIEIVDERSFIQAGQRLLEMTKADSLLITRGEEGMTLFEGQEHAHIPTVAREVFDVTGAGDTVIASLTLAVTAGASVGEAAVLANHAAGVVVGKLGTAAASVDEILASIG